MESHDTAVRAFRTVREMVADRGVASPLTAGIGDSDIEALAADGPTFAVEVNEDLTIVFHLIDQAIKKEDLLTFADGARHIILVTNQHPSGASSKSLNSAADAGGIRLEVFTVTELQYNVTRHALVPRHTRLTKEEESELIAAYGLQSRFQLQNISGSDAVARYLGLRHGDIVRIDRHSPTAGCSVNYRCCSRPGGGGAGKPRPPQPGPEAVPDDK